MGLPTPTIPFPIPTPTYQPSPTPFVIQTNSDTLNLLLGFRDNVGLGFGIGFVIAITSIVALVKFMTTVTDILSIDTLLFREGNDDPPITIKDALEPKESVHAQVIELQKTIIELQSELLKLKGI